MKPALHLLRAVFSGFQAFKRACFDIAPDQDIGAGQRIKPVELGFFVLSKAQVVLILVIQEIGLIFQGFAVENLAGLVRMHQVQYPAFLIGSAIFG